jgi:hypothetical protein
MVPAGSCGRRWRSSSDGPGRRSASADFLIFGTRRPSAQGRFDAFTTSSGNSRYLRVRRSRQRRELVEIPWGVDSEQTEGVFHSTLEATRVTRGANAGRPLIEAIEAARCAMEPDSGAARC